ncbi:MAG: OmpP1/FadL family transporter [bacterium]
MRKFIVGIGILSLLGILGTTTAYANGFKILGVKSAKSIAMAEAFIVQADDPSAIAFNPAGLIQIDGTQVSGGITVMNAWFEHTSPSGAQEKNVDTWQSVPNAFICSDFNRERMAFGMGITVPNGISSEWSESGFARYVCTYSELTLIDVNPSCAYEINGDLSVGCGLSYYYSNAILESRVDWGNLVGLPGQLDGGSKLEADGDAWGYNIGILYKLNENHGFAATFKSPFKIKYSGDAKLTDIPASLGLGSSSESKAETTIDFPAVVVLGYAYWPNNRLKLEFNLDWTNWDTLDSLVVHYNNSSFSLYPSTTFEYDYNDTLAYKIGLEYSVSELLKLRAGYIYNKNATPEANWRPSLQDTDVHFLTSGFGYTMGKFIIDGALQLVFYEHMTINNNVDNNETLSSSSVDGKYEDFGVALNFGVTYKF